LSFLIKIYTNTRFSTRLFVPVIIQIIPNEISPDTSSQRLRQAGQGIRVNDVNDNGDIGSIYAQWRREQLSKGKNVDDGAE